MTRHAFGSEEVLVENFETWAAPAVRERRVSATRRASGHFRGCPAGFRGAALHVVAALGPPLISSGEQPAAAPGPTQVVTREGRKRGSFEGRSYPLLLNHKRQD